MFCTCLQTVICIVWKYAENNNDVLAIISILILGGGAQNKSSSVTESDVRDLKEELDGCKVKLNQAAEYISYQDGQISSLTEELEELQQRYSMVQFILSNFIQ